MKIISSICETSKQRSKQIAKWACAPNRKYSPQTRICNRIESSNITSVPQHQNKKLRVAVVGGGVAGLSTALHLAPLVDSNIIEGPIEIYEKSNDDTNCSGRDIGVGLWSTGLTPFMKNSSTASENTTPLRPSHELALENIIQSGDFVEDVGYRIPNGKWLTKSRLNGELKGDEDNTSSPSLIFLREKALVDALQQSIRREEQLGTVQINYNKSVKGIKPTYNKQIDGIGEGYLDFGDNDGTPSQHSYNLIVDASGMYSSLRAQHAVHHEEVNTSVEDRGYTVFRGNAPRDAISEEEVNSFQTWGQGKNMRFAAVPFKDQIVWFATTSDPHVISQSDLQIRKELLEESFACWHDPISTLIKSTPSSTILMEKGVASRHSAEPILSLHSRVHDDSSLLSTYERGRLSSQEDQMKGYGPMLFFLGDAAMAVDPVLAQGFTMAMEDASRLANTLQLNHERHDFNYSCLRQAIYNQHINLHEPRLIALLRATELVHCLAQPESIIGGAFSHLIRPFIRACPEDIKRYFFDLMLRYSLGLVNKSNDDDFSHIAMTPHGANALLLGHHASNNVAQFF